MIATGQGKTLTKLALLTGVMLLVVACGKSGSAGGAGAGGAGAGGSGSVCGTEFSDTEFCAQTGTDGQGTKCESVSVDGNTCFNPEISYGNLLVRGIPGDTNFRNPNVADLNEWCVQLGFSSYLSLSVRFGVRSCDAPNGKLFGCSTGADVSIWHWCDSQNVDWKDGTLDETLEGHVCNVADRITEIACTP